MKLKEVKWIVFESFESIASTTTWLFISLFIWENERSLQVLLKYHIPLFIAIPLFGYIGAKLTKAISVKVSFLLSFLARGAILLIVSYQPELLLNNIMLFGVVYAVAVGLYAIPRSTAYYSVIDKENMSRIRAILLSIFTLIGLILPLFGAYLIGSQGNYQHLFTFALISLLLSAFMLVIIRIPKIPQRWDMLYVLKERSPDHNNLLKVHFIFGIKSGIQWALFGVLVLNFLDNDIENWGRFSSLIGLVGVIAGLFYAKFIAKRIDILALLITGIAYAAFSILFVVNFNFMWFAIFLAVNSISEKFIGSSLGTVISEMIEEDDEARTHLPEHYALLEFPLAIGRLIPLVILLITNASLDNDPALKLIFVVIGLVPFILTGILRKSNLVSFKLLYSRLSE